MIESLVGLYIFIAMIATAIAAYRDSGDVFGQIVICILIAPIGFAYQTGALIREVKRGKQGRY